MKIFISLITITILFASCSNSNSKADAYGNFEAVETIISAETAGKLVNFYVEEGQLIKKGDLICITDTIIQYLQKQQVLAKKEAVSSKSTQIIAQVNVLEEQKKNIIREKNRVEKLLKDSAATQKQFDDILGKIKVIEKQIEQVKVQNKSVFDELKVFDSQLDLMNEQINKSYVICPMNGTVLTKYTEQYEITVPGKPLIKIVDLENIILRAYVGETQLSELKINQKVKIIYDKGKNKEEVTGTLTWISDKAEFTPKIIQTREERVNLVYAVKIKIKNNGEIKIGMPGEVVFD